ncbi:MAG: hypothetical protein A4E69_03226 [Syntrophus sp. PtaB.Bin138]|nr:MAG: hypothetical protein A4E69_03226 [Syntrophus sp. PtaB.Bin138]
METLQRGEKERLNLPERKNGILRPSQPGRTLKPLSGFS